MQASVPIRIHLLHLRDNELPLAEEIPNGKFIGAGPLAENAAGEIDGREGQLGEQGGAEVDFPASGLDAHDAAEDEVAYFGRVAGAEGGDGEELISAEEGAGEGGEDCGLCCSSGGGGAR